MDVFLYAGALGGFLTRVPNGFRVDRPVLTIVAGKQPGAGFASGSPAKRHSTTVLRPPNPSQSLLRGAESGLSQVIGRRSL